MKCPRLGLLAGVGPSLLLGLLWPGLALGASPDLVFRAPTIRSAASNAPGTSAPVYNQQRAGSTDPALVAARNSPTPAVSPMPAASPKLEVSAAKANNKANAVQPAAYRSEPSMLVEPRRDEGVLPVQHPELIDDPTLYDEGASGGCATCGKGSCGGASACGGGLTDCVPCNFFALNGWYIGGDYLNARVNFSDPGAIVVRTVANGGLDFNDRVVPYDTSYESAYRVNAGYRWGTCGESLNFSYFNFNDSSVIHAPEVTNDVVVAGPFALNCNPGEHLRTRLDIDARVYDLDYAKRIPICTSNGGPCGDGGCPPWAITWSAGARVGQLELNSPTQLFGVNGALLADALSQVTFTGAGPKVGLEGRRYLGDCQRWSAYGKGTFSLLLGQYDVEQRLTTFGPPNAVSRQENHYTRIVPTIDLEVGLSRQLGKKTLLTAGYFMQVWIDASTVNNLNQPGVGILGPANMDDANMTMFDGFMLRLERVF